MNLLQDEEFIARCVRGDRRAMDMLVARYHGKLLDFALRHLHERESSADIAQATLVRAFERAASFRPGTSFRSWVYTIALNIIRDEIRRRAARKESLSSEVDVVEFEQADPSPEDAMLSRADAVMIWDSVDRLSENHRSAILLRFRHELTYDEIAETMGVPAGTVKSWVHYALKALKGPLETLECEE